MKEITVQDLKELLEYNSDTGIFIWLKNRGGSAKIGTIAGSKHPEGYIQIRVNGCRYLAHRLAWLYIYGDWPAQDIDHKNRVKTDNRIANLRPVSASENQQNRGIQVNTRSGYKGVSWDSRRCKWRVTVNINKKQKSLGYYDNVIEASEVYRKAAEELHSHRPT